MKLTTRRINIFLFLKLPSAFISGVRLQSISEEKAIVAVKYKWINQNPFKSMFWAVQGMASELTTGILIMQHVNKSEKKISMLVTNMNASFNKKATGKIYFECNEGVLIKEMIKKALFTNEGQTIMLSSIGKNEEGVEVSRFEYEWSLKVKNSL